MDNTQEVYPGLCVIPMPEGDYPATWDMEKNWWLIAIPGGIPAPGKAEDAHNTGMDGTWHADIVIDDRTPTIEAAAQQVADSIVAERDGWTIPFPMTVGQVEKLREWSQTNG